VRHLTLYVKSNAVPQSSGRDGLGIRIQEEESNCGGDEVLVLSGGGTVRIDEGGQKRSTRLAAARRANDRLACDDGAGWAGPEA
jgi:hypothetical protein